MSQQNNQKITHICCSSPQTVLWMTLVREYLPNSLLGEEFLPLDMFKVILCSYKSEFKNVFEQIPHYGQNNEISPCCSMPYDEQCIGCRKHHANLEVCIINSFSQLYVETAPVPLRTCGNCVSHTYCGHYSMFPSAYRVDMSYEGNMLTRLQCKPCVLRFVEYAENKNFHVSITIKPIVVPNVLLISPPNYIGIPAFVTKHILFIYVHRHCPNCGQLMFENEEEAKFFDCSICRANHPFETCNLCTERNK